ncbi:WD40/YVTN/BNR-like repeat-containing protein [Jatrophihabitans sp.]|jgi:photosystem II stability/assembly factor-like uncharacterized protein|uniref:WD40/YVTN/BNR-like repeat-containing protein n=1 Tax=Jatrophihabitans sp. TaxID=1932789 RepID=UPI002EDCA601
MSHETEPAAVQLRQALVAEARTVSAGPAFTERVIGAAQASTATLPTAVPGPLSGPRSGPFPGPFSADDGSSAGQRGWRGWILPAAAAAVVAVLLAGVLVGTSLLRPDRQPPAAQPSPTSSSTSAPAPNGTPSATARPTPSTSPSGGASTPVQGGLPAGGPVPAGFKAVDLTWVSTDVGYALGTAPCVSAPCTSILRTVDGGKSWVGLPAPNAMLSQTDTCSNSCDLVTHLRFANPDVGYAFSFNALFLTTDGGKHWARQQPDGSAYSLEIVDGMALRVLGQAPSCAPGCKFRVQRAAIGGTEWDDVALPPGARSAGAQLAASGRTAVLATFGNPAGGAQDATSVLFTSTDGGATWRKVGEPCPRTSGGGEVDTVAVTVAPDASITGLCTPRGDSGPKFTMTSTDGGAHFTAAPPSLGAATGDVLGAASATTLLVSLDQLYRSTDGGQHWQRTGNGGKGPGAASWIGFENSSVGRVLEVDGPGTAASGTVWTTTDAGRSWRANTFG